MNTLVVPKMDGTGQMRAGGLKVSLELAMKCIIEVRSGRRWALSACPVQETTLYSIETILEQLCYLVEPT